MPALELQVHGLLSIALWHKAEAESQTMAELFVLYKDTHFHNYLPLYGTHNRECIFEREGLECTYICIWDDIVCSPSPQVRVKKKHKK